MCNPRTWVQHLTSQAWATTSRGAAGLRCNMHAPSIAPSEITDAADRRIYLKQPKTQIEKNQAQVMYSLGNVALTINEPACIF